MSGIYINKELLRNDEGVWPYTAIRYNGKNFDDIVEFAGDAVVSYGYITPSVIKLSAKKKITRSSPLSDIGKECVIVTYDGETEVLINGDYLVKGLGKRFDGEKLENVNYFNRFYLSCGNDDFKCNYITIDDFCSNLFTAMRDLVQKINNEKKE